MEEENRCFLGNQDMEFIIEALNPAIKKYNRGELIFRQNSNENRFCLLLSGIAYLEIENEYDAKQILEYFVKGQILYPKVMIHPHNGHCHVIAKYPCTAAFIDLAEIEKYRQTHQDESLDYLSAFIFKSAMYMAQQHCHILQQKTIRSKILTYLYCQAERQHTFSIRLPIPYSDLADYLTVDRSALMKEISRLKAEGLIEKKSHQITLLTATPCF